MPELLTRYPKIVMSILSKMGAICGKGVEKNILKSCPTENFCFIPNVGEFCVLGLDQVNKLTQFKATAVPVLDGGQNELNNFYFILLCIIILFLFICLGCCAYRKFKREREEKFKLQTNIL